MSEVTTIRPDGSAPSPPSFQATVHATLREQLSKMGEAMSIVQMSAAMVREVYEDCDSLDGMPIDSALRGAARMLNDVFGAFVRLEEEAKAKIKEVSNG